MSVVRNVIAVGFALLLAPGPPLMAAAPAAQDPAARLGIDGTIAEIGAALMSQQLSSAALTRFYLDRINRMDRSGPMLRSVLAIDPAAETDAMARDAERAKGGRGPLQGVPILVKDNIETAGSLPTTAGSLALTGNVNGRDAPVIARLRAAGAIILGKTNLSEWANARSAGSTSGWSAVGGLTRNPHALDRSACGSSSGSGAAIAAGFATAAIGTETDGSITCPASVTGIVGMKPTVGLVPRTYIIPISTSQDTAGPMTRSVSDAALLLSIMAGSDPSDPKTAEADKHKTDYVAALDKQALQGARIGVLRHLTGYHRDTDVLFEKALTALREAGATLVDITALPQLDALTKAETVILETEMKAGLNAYLAGVTSKVKTRSLADVIAFNASSQEELRYFGQELFDSTNKRGDLASKEYKAALRTATQASGILDDLFKKAKVTALVAPTTAPAWTIDLVDGDHFLGGAMQLAAMAGYPHLSVPMGDVSGLPVGLSFIGPAWADAQVLALGFAYEQRTHARKAPQL